MLLDAALDAVAQLAQVVPRQRLAGFLRRVRAGHSVDASIFLEGLGEPELTPVLTLFRNPSFECNRVLLAAMIDAAYRHLEATTSPPTVVWTGPRLDPQLEYRSTFATLRHLVDGARDRITIAGFHVSGETLGKVGLWAARSRGVSVLAIVDRDGVTTEDLQVLTAKGILVKSIAAILPGYAKFHPKAIVVDGQWALVGSANFTLLAQTANVELGLLAEGPSAYEVERTLLSYLQVAESNGWIIAP